MAKGTHGEQLPLRDLKINCPCSQTNKQGLINISNLQGETVTANPPPHFLLTTAECISTAP